MELIVYGWGPGGLLNILSLESINQYQLYQNIPLFTITRNKNVHPFFSIPQKNAIWGSHKCYSTLAKSKNTNLISFW